MHVLLRATATHHMVYMMAYAYLYCVSCVWAICSFLPLELSLCTLLWLCRAPLANEVSTPALRRALRTAKVTTPVTLY